MGSDDSLPSIEQLESLIGCRVRYLEHSWQVIEVLEDELAIVLQADDDSERILSNALGEPVRALPNVMTLAVRSSETGGLNPVFQELAVLERTPPRPE